jgi:hypothetical protein
LLGSYSCIRHQVTLCDQDTTDEWVYFNHINLLLIHESPNSAVTLFTRVTLRQLEVSGSGHSISLALPSAQLINRA